MTTLPTLGSHFIYARMAWGLVLAALLLAAWRRRGAVSAKQAGAVTLLSMGSMWLPGAASPAYWLGLALQQPSVMLAALCARALYQPAATQVRDSTLALATPWLAALGGILYVDTLGWTRFEWYALGAHARFAPIAALVLGGIALALLRVPASRGVAVALLVALVGFSVFRWPTGNLFDALLDPLLCLMGVAFTLTAVRRMLRKMGNRPAAMS